MSRSTSTRLFWTWPPKMPLSIKPYSRPHQNFIKYYSASSKFLQINFGCNEIFNKKSTSKKFRLGSQKTIWYPKIPFGIKPHSQPHQNFIKYYSASSKFPQINFGWNEIFNKKSTSKKFRLGSQKPFGILKNHLVYLICCRVIHPNRCWRDVL